MRRRLFVHFSPLKGVIAIVAVSLVFTAAAIAAAGALDLSFSTDGKQTTDFGATDAASDVAVQADGKLVVVGGGDSPPADFVLARYNPDGSLDTSFSGDGKQVTDFSGGSDQANGVAIQTNGKIVVAGIGGGNFRDFALARYNPDGSLDTSFAGDGKQKISFTTNDGANDVALQGNGKIIAVGFAGNGGTSQWDFAVARFNPNGSLDTTFSGDGKQTTDPSFNSDYDEAKGVALQGAKIIAVGTTRFGGMALTRYNSDGTLDANFAGDGKQTTSIGMGAAANDVTLQGDGKIVVAGSAAIAGTRDFVLARYNPSGSLDATFSGDGKQTTNFGGNFDTANAVALQGTKILAVGKVGRGDASDDFALARYNPNGALDATFSGDGKQTTNFGGKDEANGVAIQADGKIVAAGRGLGTDITDTNSDFALARYLGG